MSEALAASQHWNGNPMASPLIKHITRLVCCRSVDNKSCYDAIARITSDLSDFDEVKEAILYLEYANWNAAEAFLQKELDEEDRKRPFVDADGNAIDNTAANGKLDRSFAKPGADFKADLCGIDIVIDGGVTNFTYPHASTIRPNSQADINALNRWRHATIRRHVGPAKTSTHVGTEFHVCEHEYLLNRYAEQEVDPRGRANYEKITQDFNVVFVGVFLPGRLAPCEARTKDSVTSLLTRKAVNPKEPARKWPSHYNAVMRHAAAQERVQREWQERYRANEQRAAEREHREESDGSDDGGQNSDGEKMEVESEDDGDNIGDEDYDDDDDDSEDENEDKDD